MPDVRQVGQELWIRNAVQCVTEPSTYTVIQDKDARFYPIHLVSNGRHSTFEFFLVDDDVIGFETYGDALSFCRNLGKQCLV